jgi:choline kinase
MKAIILAAGRGSRMGQLTNLKPKCLLEFRGKTLFERQITSLREAGVSEVSVVTGYKRELLKRIDLKEFYNPRWEQTNMVSSLECAAEWLKEAPCVVSYSDIFYEAHAVSSLIDCSAKLAVTYDLNWQRLWEARFGNPLLDAETFRVNFDSTLIEIGNKPVRVEEVQGQYMGLLRFTPEGWNEVVRIRSGLPSKTCDEMHMTGTLQKVIEQSYINILAIPYSGEWGEFDNENDLKSYN